ncbi:hypothetical protein M407DRAFT_244652, partial [Tulasnella calospora MUT 4182]
MKREGPKVHPGSECWTQSQLIVELLMPLNLNLHLHEPPSLVPAGRAFDLSSMLPTPALALLPPSRPPLAVLRVEPRLVAGPRGHHPRQL